MECFLGRSGICGEEASLFELEGEGLALSTIKKAWDDSREVVVRVYESEGNSSHGILRIAGARKAWVSDMKEKKGEQIACEDNKVQLRFEPFEIKTLRMSIQ